MLDISNDRDEDINPTEKAEFWYTDMVNELYTNNGYKQTKILGKIKTSKKYKVLIVKNYERDNKLKNFSTSSEGTSVEEADECTQSIGLTNLNLNLCGFKLKFGDYLEDIQPYTRSFSRSS